MSAVAGKGASFDVAGLGRVNLGDCAPVTAGQEVTLSVRPERIALHADCADKLGPARVLDRTYLGNAVEYHLRSGDVMLTVRAPRGGQRGLLDFAPGDAVGLSLEAGAPKVLVQ